MLLLKLLKCWALDVSNLNVTLVGNNLSFACWQYNCFRLSQYPARPQDQRVGQLYWWELLKNDLRPKTQKYFVCHNFNDFMKKEPCTNFCGVLISSHEAIKLNIFGSGVNDFIAANIQNIYPQFDLHVFVNFM